MERSPAESRWAKLKVTNPVKLVGRAAGPENFPEAELKGGNREPAPAAKGSAAAKAPDQVETSSAAVRAPDREGEANNDSVKVARMPAGLARMEMGGRDLTVGVVLEKGVDAAVVVESAAP